jgi:parallel beta-helix repeat protein
MNYRKALLFLLLACCIVAHAQAKDYYVSSSGSDSNPGTVKKPWATLKHAAAAVEPGATIHVAPGTYRGSIITRVSGTPDARVRWISDAKWGAKLVGDSSEAVWRNYGNYVDIEGFDITGDSKNGIFNLASNVRITGNQVHDMVAPCGSPKSRGGGIDNGGYTTADNDVIDNVVHDIGTPANCPDHHGHGIYHSTLRGHIFNNISYRNGGCGIHLWHAANNVVVSNNLTFSNGICGIVVGAGDAPGGITNDNTLVSNNIVLYNGSYGIYETGYTGRGNRYLNNIVYGNSRGAFKLSNGLKDVGTITADPQTIFLNWQSDGNGDYRLKPGSPAIGKGTPDGAPGTDHAGAARTGKQPDIGPFSAVESKAQAKKSQ